MLTAPATLPLSQVHLNEENPRLLKEPAFLKLVASLEHFPEMLTLRPLVVDENGIVLGGNMRCRAKSHLLELPKKEKQARIAELVAARVEAQGYASEGPEAQAHRALLLDLFTSDALPVTHARGLTERQKREFILKDNATFGEWDWDALANDPDKWGDAAQLEAFGLNLPKDWDQESEEHFEDPGIKAKTQFGVIVLCHSELDQESVFTRLTGEGLTCKIVLT